LTGEPRSGTRLEGWRDQTRRRQGTWYALPAEEVLVWLGSTAQGLSAAEARRRLRAVGPNSLTEIRRPSLLKELTESLGEPLQLLLILVGVLSAIWGELRDAIAIFVIIAAVAVTEAATEWRARKALDALKSLTAPRARVLRDGRLVEVAARDLVPGDVLAVEAGDVVAADLPCPHRQRTGRR
jgi:Ca2+-transporting ATPase